MAFEKKGNLDLITCGDFKNQLMNILKKPFTNLFVDLGKVEQIDAEGLNTLMAGQRLSEINQSQLCLFNVKEGVLSSMKQHKLERCFFFCDRPKVFSNSRLLV